MKLLASISELFVRLESIDNLILLCSPAFNWWPINHCFLSKACFLSSYKIATSDFHNCHPLILPVFSRFGYFETLARLTPIWFLIAFFARLFSIGTRRTFARLLRHGFLFYLACLLLFVLTFL